MNRVVITVLFLSCVIPIGGTLSLSHAGKTGIELSTRSVAPGGTLVLSGKGFGTFKSTQFNRVTVNGVSALVQRWDREVIEVKVPLKATSGFVEVLIGKKKLLAGFVNLAMPRIETITPTEAERGDDSSDHRSSFWPLGWRARSEYHVRCQ